MVLLAGDAEPCPASRIPVRVGTLLKWLQRQLAEAEEGDTPMP